MNTTIENGTRQERNGVTEIHYEGYWIKYYNPPSDTLSAKKSLIQSLTRRLFNHMEHGINIPGRLLDDVRPVYEKETDPKKKRVKGAMLAGALFNRAADIFTLLVDIEASGVAITPDNDLMHTCGTYLQEALQMGKLVKHRNGDEGIDELWGEPFKAFVMSISDFYESRYIKIALTMKNIDQVADFMISCISAGSRYQGVKDLIKQHARAARHKCEILRTDPDIFEVWSEFVVTGEDIINFVPAPGSGDPGKHQLDELDGKHMLKAGVRLIAFITRARTPMPKSTESYMEECRQYRNRSC